MSLPWTADHTYGCILGNSVEGLAVTQKPKLRAFLSYARHDAETDPDLIEALTSDLERRVASRLPNERFKIWRDTLELRTGDAWSSTIAQEINKSDILIVLLTPMWLASAECKREYELFLVREKSFNGGQYVAPILIRPIDPTKLRLTADQVRLLVNIKRRQYFKELATDYRRMSHDKRILVTEQIADDISGIVERRLASLSKLPIYHSPSTSSSDQYPVSEVSGAYHDFKYVDFYGRAEVVIKATEHPEIKSVNAQVDFMPGLYVKGARGIVAFSVKRAYLIVYHDGSGQLRASDHLSSADTRHYVYHVRLHDAPSAISVCMNPEPGKPALRELALPPTDGNYLSQIAFITGNDYMSQWRAELRIGLNTDGLYLAESNDPERSQTKKSQIQAIIHAAVRKGESLGPDNQIRRNIPVEGS